MTGHIKELQLPLVTDYQKGWLGGMLDGDGILGLHISVGGKKRTNKRGFSWKPAVIVSNTNKDIAQAVCNFFNKKRPPKMVNRADGGKRKKIWRVQLNKSEIRWVCDNLILVGKEKQRQLLKEAISLIDRVGGKRPLDHPSEYRLIQIYQELRALNKRGIAPSKVFDSHQKLIYQALGLPYQTPEGRG